MNENDQEQELSPKNEVKTIRLTQDTEDSNTKVLKAEENSQNLKMKKFPVKRRRNAMVRRHNQYESSNFSNRRQFNRSEMKNFQRSAQKLGILNAIQMFVLKEHPETMSQDQKRRFSFHPERFASRSAEFKDNSDEEDPHSDSDDEDFKE
jgi:hypothetical protein